MERLFSSRPLVTGMTSRLKLSSPSHVRSWLVADAMVAGPSVRNSIKFRRQSQARLTGVGGEDDVANRHDRNQTE